MSRIWKKTTVALLLVAALAVLAGCGTHENPAVNENALRQAIVGKTWTLRKVVARSYSDDPARTLEFKADGTASGFGGCNAFHGTYTLTGSELSFGPMASTRKSCGPGMDEQEYTYLTMLAKVAHVKVEDDGAELVLLTENQGEIIFTSGDTGLFW